MTISRLIIRITRSVSNRRSRENQNTCFIFSNFFFPENRAVNIEKYGGVSDAADDNMAYARCMLDK
jgi:hypothetical protein